MVVGSGEPTGSVTAGTRWLLAYCDDGVVWGRRDGDDQGWRLSSGPFPAISPPFRGAALQQARLFGPDVEVSIWRTDDTFRGRLLADAAPADDPALHAAGQTYVVLGDRWLDGPRDGFTLVGDGTGSRHAVPLSCSSDAFRQQRMPLRMRARHYFTQDPDVGVVRVAATRLVTLEQEGQR